MLNELEVIPAQAAGDLAACEREPIHIPGRIQPHGILLSLSEPSLAVLQASANASELFGRDIHLVTGATLTELFGEQANELIRELRSHSLEKNPLYLGSLSVPGPSGVGRSFRAIAHCYQHALILELEEAGNSQTLSFQNLYPLVRDFMARLQDATGIPELTHITADEVRRITGFDRVLIYKFDPEWHGHVIAESRDEDLPPYLDLWFPASDIPAQARELYRVNRLRLIADANCQPVPLVPMLDPRTKRPLDLTYAALRSVSPVHIEYLKNMGVAASMSISLVHEGRLWGLLSLHHRQPRFPSFEMRVACDFLGQAFTTHLSARESQAEYEHRLYLKLITTSLLGFMAEEEHFLNGLIHHPDELLSFADASGAAILFEGRCTLFGRTPGEQEVRRFVDWLSARGQEEVFHTDALPSLIPDGEAFRQSASGILAISISKLYRSYVLWFRPEVVQTVKWGGDPRKPVEIDADGSGRIHPRKSFETWKQTVRGRSLPWRLSEVESASDLRNAIVGVVLRKAEELAALTHELQRSNRELEAFSYSVSHDLRAPFRHIIGYADLLRDHFAPVMDETGDRFLSTISRAADSAGRLVDDLLTYARVGRVKLHLTALDMNRLFGEVKTELFGSKPLRPVLWNVSDLPTIQADPIMMRLVWQNLLSNAAKFTRKADPAAITVGAWEAEDEITFFIRDNGVGFKQQYAGKLFGIFQRLHSSDDFEGTGIGLASVRRAVEKHGGRTWAEGQLGNGAAFYFSIPRRIHLERGSDG